MNGHLDTSFRATSPSLRGAKIDVLASAIEMQTYHPLPRESAMKVRREIAAGLDRALVAGTKPARFRVRLIESHSNPVLLFAPCLVVLTLLGCPGPLEDATVEVVLEVDGKTYTQTGRGSAVRFVLSPQHDRVPHAAAVGDAISDALRKIDAEAR